jgi:hypothetical protein
LLFAGSFDTNWANKLFDRADAGEKPASALLYSEIVGRVVFVLNLLGYNFFVKRITAIAGDYRTNPVKRVALA